LVFKILYISGMDRLKDKIGISAAVLIVVACVFKAFHLQGAAAVLTLGFLFFSVVYMPLVVVSMLKEKKIILAIAGVFLSTLTLGVLFRILHLPYAMFIISWSVTLCLFCVAPIYILSNYFAETNETLSESERRRNILFGVLALAVFALWYALLDLTASPSSYSFS